MTRPRCGGEGAFALGAAGVSEGRQVSGPRSAAGAEAIAGSDGDLLLFHPCRGVRTLSPADCLARP